jgi:O-antigen ligase
MVVAIIMLFPTAAFGISKGAGGSFYLLLLCSLVALIFRLEPRGRRLTWVLKEYKWVSLAMAGLLLAAMANQLSRGHFLSSDLEEPFYLACFPLLLWVLSAVSEKNLKRIPWAWAVGAIVCVIALQIQTCAEGGRPIFVLDTPLIPFVDITLMSGMLIFFSLGWEQEQSKRAVALKILACFAALYGSYFSETRGSWLALPFFFVLALFVSNWRYKFLCFPAMIALLGILYLSSHTVQERIAVANSDITQFLNEKNKDTSLGQRIQNWEGAWRLYRENMVFGVGKDQYRHAIEELVQRGAISPVAAAQPHSHNDILFEMATYGTFGLVAIIALYFVPALFFFKELRNADQQIKSIAGMGIALTMGFFIFGLSDAMFFWRISFVYYVIELAVLFACLEIRKQQSPFQK